MGKLSKLSNGDLWRLYSEACDSWVSNPSKESSKAVSELEDEIVERMRQARTKRSEDPISARLQVIKDSQENVRTQYRPV